MESNCLEILPGEIPAKDGMDTEIFGALVKHFTLKEPEALDFSGPPKFHAQMEPQNMSLFGNRVFVEVIKD
jgi:hypothetical protein